MESLLPGRAPSGLSKRKWEQSLDFCAALPRSNSSPTGLEEDLTDLSARAPEILPALGRCAPSVATLWWAGPRFFVTVTSGPAICWLNTGTLRGVIDWDTWHPSSPPGVDVLHLCTSATRPGAGRRLGEVFEATVWRSRDSLEATRSYWGNHFESRLTNGYAEGITNRIKVIKRRAYGCPNFHSFRRRVLLACG